jgi:hypothetical protein
MIRTHFGQHDRHCYGCKLATIQFGNVEAPGERLIESQWDRDLPAYARLRRQGYQPPRTQGCAELEARAHMPREIEKGRIINPQAWREVGHMVEDAESTAAQLAPTPPEEIREWKNKAYANR